MDAKDVLGDGCEQMLAAANSKRHAELITRLYQRCNAGAVYT